MINAIQKTFDVRESLLARRRELLARSAALESDRHAEQCQSCAAQANS